MAACDQTAHIFNFEKLDGPLHTILYETLPDFGSSKTPFLDCGEINELDICPRVLFGNYLSPWQHRCDRYIILYSNVEVIRCIDPNNCFRLFLTFWGVEYGSL